MEFGKFVKKIKKKLTNGRQPVLETGMGVMPYAGSSPIGGT